MERQDGIVKLPTFIGIGAPRTGTSSVYYYLAQHPDIYMCPVKEARFFSVGDPAVWGTYQKIHGSHSAPDVAARTWEEYVQLFSAADEAKALGEITPDYLYSSLAATRIREALPSVRLLLGLRNPVDRAISSYLHHRRSGSTLLASQEALGAESPYVYRSLYSPHVKRYLSLFDRTQIFVWTAEELGNATTGVMQRMYEFIGVTSDYVPDVTVRYNEAQYPTRRLYSVLARPYARRAVGLVLPKRLRKVMVRRRNLHGRTPAALVSEEIKIELTRLFYDDIMETSELLGVDLNGWTGD